MSYAHLLAALSFVASIAAENEDEEFDAWEYIDNYSENVDKDENFDENLDRALTGAREDISLYATWFALLPPVIAIALALITKEVYSSLFIGIVTGAALYAGGSFSGTIDHLFAGGFIASVADSYNIGIIFFLIVLGAIVALMNKAGGSAAFGRWASKHIKSKVGAQLATVALGVLIFVDDYFNCLTVGSVMRPVTDKFKISRAKLAYVIDATAAPVCIIAPISSWAAAVAGFVPEGQNGFSLFIQAIPYNFYAFLTIAMMITLAVRKFDYGPMKKHEKNAEAGDLFSSDDAEAFKALENADEGKKGIVWDLVAPVAVSSLPAYWGSFIRADSSLPALTDIRISSSHSPRRTLLSALSAARLPASYSALYTLC